jgi:acetate kinase
MGGEGGCTGYKMSDEEKKLRSEKQKNVWNYPGYRENIISKISTTQKNHKQSETTIQRKRDNFLKDNVKEFHSKIAKTSQALRRLGRRIVKYFNFKDASMTTYCRVKTYHFVIGDNK